MPPRVSLIASTYRSERFLPAWLENMAAQSVWADAELVVVANDPDSAEDALLRDFAEAHDNVRVLTVEREPLYRSWNRAIMASNAPLLAIANVDDLRTPTGLEAQVRALEAGDGALFAYGGYAVSTEFPPDPSAARPVAAVAFEREEFTRSMHLGPFFVWRRRSDPATMYFDEQLRVGADFDLAVRLALHGEGVAVEEPLGFYYDGGTGLSTGGETQSVELAVLVLRYGIYDKVDPYFVAQASEYTIPQILMPAGEWLPMTAVVPGYADFLRERRERWWPKPRQRGLKARLAR